MKPLDHGKLSQHNLEEWMDLMEYMMDPMGARVKKGVAFGYTRSSMRGTSSAEVTNRGANAVVIEMSMQRGRRGGWYLNSTEIDPISM